jgi:hypothetical protein
MLQNVTLMEGRPKCTRDDNIRMDVEQGVKL